MKHHLKTILITGAGSGFGKASALELAKRGHSVIATTETQAQADALAKSAQDAGVAIETMKLDITNQSDRDNVRGRAIDVLINNAGIGETGSISEIPMDRLRRNFEVNVFGTLEMTQLALAQMVKQGHGTVITISSIAGRAPRAFLSPYSMTKYALSGGMAALREEMYRLNKNIHVSLIEPGAYATGFNERMTAKKYEWMAQGSFFASIIPDLKKDDEFFPKFEIKSLDSIVKKIVCAAESESPNLRYSAPWYQYAFTQVQRIFGA